MKRLLKTFLILLISTATFTSCNNTTGKETPKYEILSNVSGSFNKGTFKILLEKKTDKEGLSLISKEIREAFPNYDKIFIQFYVKGMDINSACWGNSSYTPDLEVEINGSSNKEDSTMSKATTTKTSSIKGDIIGIWKDSRPGADCEITIYKDGQKYFMLQVFGDGSSGTEECIKKTKKGVTIYQQKGNTFGEYYAIESNDNLGMYSSNGKFSEANKK